MLIPSRTFAATARNTYDQSIVPYKRGGDTLRGMDSGGFIEYCLRKNGIDINFSGTNDIFRNASSNCIPLKEAIRKKLVVPGVILLHISNDGGEPSKYRADGKGNCDYALIAINSKEGVYPSQKQGRLIKTAIEPVNGKANWVMFCKYIDYGRSITSNTAGNTNNNAGISKKTARTTTTLRLRKEPTTTSPVITEMPENARVEILANKENWYFVKYKETYRYEGWCSGSYLEFD